MPRRSRLALIAGLTVAGCLCVRAAPLSPPATLSVFAWQGSARDFGGFSGLIVTPDGTGFMALTDRGLIVDGRFARAADGSIRGVSAGALRPLQGLTAPEDSEDLAPAPDGGFLVAYESRARISRYAADGSPEGDLPRAPVFARLPRNKRLETVAMAPDGAIWTVPESPLRTGGFAVYRFFRGDWRQHAVIPARGAFLPVSGDFGPDGRFYLLEREFTGITGFATRLRRFTPADSGLTDELTIIETSPGQWDNLEAVSVWRGTAGLVATMLSDDNFLPVQRTEFVEIALPD